MSDRLQIANILWSSQYEQFKFEVSIEHSRIFISRVAMNPMRMRYQFCSPKTVTPLIEKLLTWEIVTQASLFTRVKPWLKVATQLSMVEQQRMWSRNAKNLLVAINNENFTVSNRPTLSNGIYWIHLKFAEQTFSKRFALGFLRRIEVQLNSSTEHSSDGWAFAFFTHKILCFDHQNNMENIHWTCLNDFAIHKKKRLFV